MTRGQILAEGQYQTVSRAPEECGNPMLCEGAGDMEVELAVGLPEMGYAVRQE